MIARASLLNGWLTSCSQQRNELVMALDICHAFPEKTLDSGHHGTSKLLRMYLALLDMILEVFNNMGVRVD
jgi:hypothetical protein